MDIKEMISSYIDQHTEEMVADTMELCRINSEKGAAEAGMPFGKGPCEALKNHLFGTAGGRKKHGADVSRSAPRLGVSIRFKPRL